MNKELTTIATPTSGGQRMKLPAWESIRRFNTLFILLALVICSSLFSADFLTGPNVSNVSRQVAGVGIMSMGMLLVVLTGGIDLSVGSVAALSSVTTALLIPQMGMSVAIAGGLLSGIVCGAVSGALIAFYRLSPFVVTLATMTVARGIAMIVSKGAPILVSEEAQPLLDFGRNTWVSIPQPTAMMLIVFAIGAVFLGLTRAGRIVRAIGSNEEAVRLSGVSIGFYTLLTYVAAGFLSALAGVVSVARSGVGAPSVGVGDELTVIAAVVIGGASLAGGRGTVLNTLVGVLVLGIIANIMNLTSVPGYHQQVVTGVIIVVAILAQRGSGLSR